MEDLADTLRAWLQEHAPDVAAAWLFGSRARGTATAASDVDVAVLFRGSVPPARALDIEGGLERAVRHEVQVTALNAAPADLVHRVLRDGVLLVENDRSARVRFEVARRNEYWDLLPYLQLYRRAGRVTP